MVVFYDDTLCYDTTATFVTFSGVLFQKRNLVRGHGLPLGIWGIVNIFGFLFSVSAKSRCRQLSFVKTLGRVTIIACTVLPLELR